MRTYVLLFVLALPPLVACGAAYAKASSADIGKPVCTHYDDAARSADASAKTDSGTTAANGTATSPMAAAPAQAAVKGGGSSSAMRQHSSPRWQAFLPGMFR